jgi:hypothetical protein
MRDQPTSELTQGVTAHSQQRFVSTSGFGRKNKSLTPQAACDILLVKIGNEPGLKRRKHNDDNRKNKSRPASERSLERGRGRLVGGFENRPHLRQQRYARRPRMDAQASVELIPNGSTMHLSGLCGYYHKFIGGELVTSLMSADEVKRYLASIGSKGGKTTGASKVRGDAAYYKRISRKAAKARKASARRANIRS